MDLQKLAKNAALRLTDDDNRFRGYPNAEDVITNAIRSESGSRRTGTGGARYKNFAS